MLSDVLMQAAKLVKVTNEDGSSYWTFADAGMQNDPEESKEEQRPRTESIADNDNTDVSETKKKKKKKKRNRSHSNVSTTSVTSSAAKKTVKFNAVEEIAFTREHAYDVVPNRGSCPLGLGSEVSRQVIAVDEHVKQQQELLKQRAQELNLPANEMLETRQYDFKRSPNPLFAPTSEEDRVCLLQNVTYDNHYISELNKSIKQIQLDRKHAGCDCKPTKADKLSVIKLKQELMKHADKWSGVDLETSSKAELMSLAKEVLRNCPMCIDNNCICVQNEVACHADVCGCLKHGYHPENQQVCGNPVGRSMFNAATVSIHRESVMNSICSK